MFGSAGWFPPEIQICTSFELILGQISSQNLVLDCVDWYLLIPYSIILFKTAYYGDCKWFIIFITVVESLGVGMFLFLKFLMCFNSMNCLKWHLLFFPCFISLRNLIQPKVASRLANNPHLAEEFHHNYLNCPQEFKVAVWIFPCNSNFWSWQQFMSLEWYQ